jgi:predicted dehydrogenase
MALDLTPEQKEVGKANFHRAVGEFGLTRRDFMKGLLAAGAVLPISAAAYFGYNADAVKDKPVKAALIGSGDEGGVLIGEHNPKYLEFVAVCDFRPSNQDRIFTGDVDDKGVWKGTVRRGFEHITPYGSEARQKIKVFTDYRELLNDTKLGIEAVVIALPLHLHATVAMDAMKAGKHVLCEKLMAWNINWCKQMIKVAEETDRILCIGHQRHYSLLYAHAVEVMKSGILGDVKHIRALWHRNNAQPKVDKDGKPIPDMYRDSWRPDIPQRDRQALEKDIRKLGYKSMEELVRWRLYNRTGGGLMAELGSHQLDACSIFLGKVHPLAVTGVGGKYFYHDDREVDDHVFVTFEFPGPGYFADPEHKEVKDRNDIVVVTYSSISTNAFEPYGECVMGSHGTMIVEKEESVMLYTEGAGARSTAVSVTNTGGKPALDSSASGPGAAQAVETGQKAVGPPSRGYREEMEHFAYCIRMHGQAGSSDEKKKWRETPRCHGKVAMADAIIALTSNEAMKTRQRIEFKPEWFDAANLAVPDADMQPEIITG